MHDGIGPTVLIRHDDLQALVEIVESRFAEPGREASRITLVRDWLTAGFELNRLLTIQTRCALVNHCGTKGNSNLTDQTDRLFKALAIYASLTSDIAAELKVAGPGPDPNTEPELLRFQNGPGRRYARAQAAGADR